MSCLRIEPGYDVMKVYLRADNHLYNTLYMNSIAKIYLEMYVPGSIEPTRLTFKIVPEYHKAIAYDEAYIDLIGECDTIERPRVIWSSCHINESSKDIELYLRKTMTDPIDEINWDGTMNPFRYIIQLQYNKISPYPEAATTLYTDYNITSSKIITADNITTMRSDVNLLTNNFDVMEYDFDNLTYIVIKLQKDMITQQQITQHIRAELDAIHLANKIKLVFGLIGLISEVGGLVVAAMGIDFGTKAIYDNIDVSSSSSLEDLQSLYPEATTSMIRTENAGSMQRIISSVGSESNRLNDYWNQYRDLVMDFDIYDGDTEMCDLIFERLNDLTRIIEDEFPGAQMPPWVSSIVHVRESATILEEKNDEKNILNTLIKWCNTKYTRLDDPTKYKNNWVNSEKDRKSVV